MAAVVFVLDIMVDGVMLISRSDWNVMRGLGMALVFLCGTCMRLIRYGRRAYLDVGAVVEEVREEVGGGGGGASDEGGLEGAAEPACAYELSFDGSEESEGDDGND